MGTHPIFESDFDCLTDRNRTRCVPNCVTFPASRSTPVTASAPSVTMASRSVSCRQRLVPCTMTRRTHASCAGLSYTELLAKKQQKPEIRQKQRDNAIKAAKEKKKAADASKAAARKAMPKVASKAQAKMPKAPKMKGSGGKR